MGRMRRVEYKGAIYHVIQRGNNKQYIFKEEIDKGFLIKQLKECREGMGLRIFGYVLMGNHYHFLLQTLDRPLREVMHHINNKYSKFFNYKYGHCGHVFQGRYTAIPVLSERYLKAVVRYIHQNPVEANICSHVSQYKWSSDIFYRTNMKGFVDIDFVLDIFSENRVRAIKEYMAYMEKTDDGDYENVRVIGEEPEEKKEPFKEPFKGSASVGAKRKSLDELLAETGVSDMDFQLIKSGSRKRHLTEYKIIFAQNALELKYTFEEIGRSINTTGTAIGNLLKRHNINMYGAWHPTF